MLFYLLGIQELHELFDRMGYALDDDTVQRTVEYYLARTSHGSTLSKVVHAWVLSRVDCDASWKLFVQAA